MVLDDYALATTTTILHLLFTRDTLQYINLC